MIPPEYNHPKLYKVYLFSLLGGFVVGFLGGVISRGGL